MDVFQELGNQLALKARQPDIHGYKPAPQQIRFHECPKKQRIILGGNRCLAEGTLVRMADHSLRKIEEILPGEYVLGVEAKTLLPEPSKVVEVIYNGEKPCNKYSFGNQGVVLAELICTPDHKILLDYESHGSYTKDVTRIERTRSKRVGALRTIEYCPEGLYDEWAMLLGYMVANGCTTQKSRVQLTCADITVLEQIKLPKDIVIEQQENRIQFAVRPTSQARDYLINQKLWGKYSHEKQLPESVFTWNNRAVGELLAGLFAGDGSFYISGGKFAKACYTSTSLRLVEQVKDLLELRFGVYGSRIKTDSRENKRDCYYITYGTYEALSKLASLPIPGEKGTKASEILKYCKKVGSRSSRVKLISCEDVGTLPTYDLAIEHSDHLFLVEDNLIVHNSGKSYGSVVEMIWWATGTHPYRRTPRPPLALRHVAVDKPQGIDKVLKELYKKICPPSYLRGNSFEKAWAKEPPVLHFENGSTIEFLSYEQDLDKHAGTSRHAIAFDEEPDEAIFNENLARLIDTDGEWWIAMTPLEGLTWIYHNYYEPWEKGELEEATELFIYNTDDNTYLPAGAFDRLMGNLTVEERNARRKGQFIALSGLIYPTFDHSYHVRDLEPMKGLDNFTSMDHGLANATSWHWYQCDSDGIIYVQREHYESGLLVSDHAKAVKQMEASYPWLRPEYRVGDPSIQNRNAETGQSIQTAYADHGVFIGLGNNDVDAGINRVAELFNTGRLFIDSTNRNLIRELRRYRWAEWASRKAATKNDAKNRPNKKNDHACDDLRYAAMSRPFEDLGPGPVKAPIDFTKITVPDIKLAEPEEARDYRDSVFDDELGSEW